MNESPIARRRAVPVVAAALLVIGIVSLLQAWSAVVAEPGSSVPIQLGFDWWYTAAEIVFIGALAYFSHHTDKKWTRIVGWIAVAAATASIFTTELDGLMWQSGALDFRFLRILGASAFIGATTVIVVEKELEAGTNGRAKFGVKASPWLIAFAALISLLTPSSADPMAIMGGSLCVFGVCALLVHADRVREEKLPDGIITESGALLILSAIGARIALLTLAAISIAFHGMTDVTALAAVCSALAVVTVPAAYGASRFSEKIVREAHPDFRRATVLWWGAVACLVLQFAWIWVVGASLLTFIPAVVALVADVVAWESVRRGIKTWGEHEGMPLVEARARAARFPILGGGIILLGTFGAAFVSTTATAVATLIGGLVAFVGGYLMLQALFAVWARLRDASYVTPT